MTGKVKILKEEIKLGNRTNLIGNELSLEDYLSKDEDGITFLEFLLQNKISLPYTDTLKLKNSPEVAYIYCQNNQSLYSFDLTEENLFYTVNGKMLIETILEKGKLTNRIISAVKDHTEIVDMLISSDNKFYLEYLSQDVVNKLITKDIEESYKLEKYLDDERIYKYIIPLINDYDVLEEISNKTNKTNFLKYCNTNILMNKTSEDEFVVQKLLDSKIVPEVLETLPKDVEFIKFLIDNNYSDYTSKTSATNFLLNIEENKTLFEVLLEKGYKPQVKGTIWDEEFIRLINDKNCLDVVNESKIDENILIKPLQEVLNIEDPYNRTFLDYLIDNGYKPLKEASYISKPEVIKILYNKGFYEILGEKTDSKKLLLEVEPGVLLIDKLLAENIKIDVSSVENIEIANKLYKANRFDLLATMDIDTLLEPCDQNNTYFDFVLESIKERKTKYSLMKYKCKNENKAKFYMLIAKHDMMKYVRLDEDNLLEKNGENTLLEKLLDMDTSLTVNNIVSEKMKSNAKVSIILKSRGIESEKVDVIEDNQHFTKEYLDEIASANKIGPVYNEGESLINKLYELFIKDGKSDPELVTSLLDLYKEALINNYELNIHEVRRLVEIKENNFEDFCYIKKEDSGYFSLSTGAIYCDDITNSTLLHETGHAIHHYLRDSKIPDEYESIVERIIQNPETLKKVEEYSKNFNTLVKTITESVEKKCDEYFESNFKETENEIIEFLNKSKQEQKDEFKDLGISEEALDVILSEIFTKEEYMDHKKRAYVKENVDAILRSEFGAYLSLGDFFDGVYDGDLQSGELTNEKGEKIKKTYGHGVAYYFASSHGFDEMYANYSMIIKSKDGDKALQILEDTLGKELMDMLNNFYEDTVINQQQNNLEESKVL